MTPLAFELLRDLQTPGAFRFTDHEPDAYHCKKWAKYFRSFLWQARFFDCAAMTTEIANIAQKISDQFSRNRHFARKLAFLPHANTWIELDLGVSDPRMGRRVAILATGLEGDSTHDTSVLFVFRRGSGWWIVPATKDDVGGVPMAESAGVPTSGMLEPFMLYAALAFINTPRVIGRRTHFPHLRAEREKIKQLGLVGKFPLRAWTEIILKVQLPDDKTGEPSQEAHLTGERCQHFCRTYLRVKNGTIEYVEGHWRGNPALGMKRSRYRLEDHRNGEQCDVKR